DESCSITLLVHIVFAERHEALIVKRVLTRATHNGHCALVQLECDTTSDALLSDIDERIVRFTLGGPPASLVNEICIAGRNEILRGERATIENELLELAVRGVE